MRVSAKVLRGVNPTVSPRKLNIQYNIIDTTKSDSLIDKSTGPIIYLIFVYEESYLHAHARLGEGMLQKGIVSSGIIGKLAELFHQMLNY